VQVSSFDFAFALCPVNPGSHAQAVRWVAAAVVLLELNIYA
jgi:hypothetical protein